MRAFVLPVLMGLIRSPNSSATVVGAIVVHVQMVILAFFVQTGIIASKCSI